MEEALDKKYLVLSDIHGNLSALDSVLEDCHKDDFSGIIILGDVIDYGMRPKEVIKRLVDLSDGDWADRIIANIWGNHELMFVDGNVARLSSDRGRDMAKYTAEHMDESSADYVKTRMKNEPYHEFVIGNKSCLAVHGSLDDAYWKMISPDDVRGDYSKYDIVFSGHSHFSHCFNKFYESNNQELRNKKSVLFINPGSVGQPRNQNPYAQYAVLMMPSLQVELRAAKYDVEFEQSLYPDEVDGFYKERLALGV